jgi:hypothetical protein
MNDIDEQSRKIEPAQWSVVAIIVAFAAGAFLRLRAIDGGAFAATALVLMEERKITSRIVTGVDDLGLGVAHLHDLRIFELI